MKYKLFILALIFCSFLPAQSSNPYELPTYTPGVLPSRAPAASVLNPNLPAQLGPFPTRRSSQLWSNPATWGGKLPAAGEVVTIPQGKAVVLDTSTPALGGLVINGALYIAEQDITLTTRYIMVHGLLQAGTVHSPFRRNFTITLTGTDPAHDLHTMGTKLIGAMGGGVVDLHGFRRESVAWTKLAVTARPGDTVLRLTDSVEHSVPFFGDASWRVGDRIMLAPSGWNAAEAETVTITSVNQNQITVSPALRFIHWGELQTIQGRPVDERAAVGLLTRNIVIQGDEASEANQFGGHVMIMAGSVGRFTGVEFFRMGQMGIIGRYPLHWHWVDRYPALGVNGGHQFAVANSVHRSFHRAVVVHGTNGVQVDNNVAYDVHSHIFVPAEDGDEEDNLFRYNLAVFAKPPLPGRNAFPIAITNGPAQGSTLQWENKPSSFWMRNTNQVFLGNIAAGSHSGNGFFFDGFLQYDPKNPVTEPLRFQKPARTLWFQDNVAHSHCSFTKGPPSFDGTIYSGGANMHGVLFHKAAVGRNLTAPLEMVNVTAFKNCRSAVWLESSREVLRDSTLADNNWGAIPEHGPRMFGIVVAGSTGNDTGGHATDRGGLVFNDAISASFRLEDSTFVGLLNGALTLTDKFVVQGGFFRNNQVINGPRFGASSDLRGPSTGCITDEDGSLSGTGRRTFISINPLDSTSLALEPVVIRRLPPQPIRIFVTPAP